MEDLQTMFGVKEEVKLFLQTLCYAGSLQNLLLQHEFPQQPLLGIGAIENFTMAFKRIVSSGSDIDTFSGEG